MDPKRDFRLLGAAALVSKAKKFGISVATLKTPPGHQPGRAARTNPRYPNHDGTIFLDLSLDEDKDVVGSGSEWAEYEASDEEDDLETSPTMPDAS
eukprot:jgi/Tetstr1/436351/TSEL_025187.t1